MQGKKMNFTITILNEKINKTISLKVKCNKKLINNKEFKLNLSQWLQRWLNIKMEKIYETCKIN